MSAAIEKARAARAASAVLSQASAGERTAAILAAAAAVDAARNDIMSANAADMARGRAQGLTQGLLDRLMLDEGRIDGIVAGMRKVASQPDPIGRVTSGCTLDSGLRLTRVTVPLGVVAMVYEARPNVTADAICLTLRSGNACVLRGGTAAHDSCMAIAAACRKGIASAGLPADCATIIESPDRAETQALMRANGLVDVLIPRGGHSLIRACVENATVPTIETGEGNCHVYVHEAADLAMARRIVMNAKTQRTGVCNAAESLLVDRAVASAFLPEMVCELAGAGVTVHGDEETRSAAPGVVAATEQDWGREYLALEISCKVVGNVDEAIEHINRYGTRHSECIVTEDLAASEAFLARVDAAAVYVNASTRFTDGGMFGLGAEIGISTQKLHVRGPMGADALTTTKCLLRGDGQVRP